MIDILSFVRDGRLSVIVKPKAPKTEVIGWDSEREALRIAVSAVPDKDRANRELVKFISKQLKRKVRLLRGAKSREKVLSIE